MGNLCQYYKPKPTLNQQICLYVVSMRSKDIIQAGNTIVHYTVTSLIFHINLAKPDLHA